jgi:hypothetical protein
MSYAKKIVLNCPAGYKVKLAPMVEDFIRDGVIFVGIVGKDCAKIEDMIDELVVADARLDYDLQTSSHPGDSLQGAIEFAKSLELKGEVQVVEL